ncbi:MAG: hypothetical protein IPI49_11190 [Myxococcales bacterium]|nr:hypothetical protein [Myxococcales bacterium]
MSADAGEEEFFDPAHGIERDPDPAFVEDFNPEHGIERDPPELERRAGPALDPESLVLEVALAPDTVNDAATERAAALPADSADSAVGEPQDVAADAAPAAGLVLESDPSSAPVSVSDSAASDSAVSAPAASDSAVSAPAASDSAASDPAVSAPPSEEISAAASVSLSAEVPARRHALDAAFASRASAESAGSSGHAWRQVGAAHAVEALPPPEPAPQGRRGLWTAAWAFWDRGAARLGDAQSALCAARHHLVQSLAYSLWRRESLLTARAHAPQLERMTAEVYRVLAAVTARGDAQLARRAEVQRLRWLLPLALPGSSRGARGRRLAWALTAALAAVALGALVAQAWRFAPLYARRTSPGVASPLPERPQDHGQR